MRLWALIGPILFTTLISCTPAPGPTPPAAGDAELAGQQGVTQETAQVGSEAVVQDVGTPQVVLPDGWIVHLDLALTPQEQQIGLMFRPTLAEDKGMLFLFGERGPSGFWMKNTLVNLDIVYLDSEARIVDIAANVPPCHQDPCPRYRPKSPATAVLEIAGGVAATHGATIGTVLRFDQVDGYPVGDDAQDGPASP